MHLPLLHKHTTQDTIVAIRRGGDKLVVANLDEAKFPVVDFNTDPSQVCSCSWLQQHPPLTGVQMQPGCCNAGFLHV